MISDRYIPDADDYEPAPSHRSSKRTGTHGEGKEQQHKKHHGSHKSKHSDKSRHREASNEDEEEGEIVDPAAEGAAASAAAAAGGSVGLNTTDAAANGKHRYPAEEHLQEKADGDVRLESPLGSPDGSSKQPGSSKPPSGKRERSKERSRERSSSQRDKDRGKDRDKGRDKERESERERERDRAKQHSRDPSREQGKERSSSQARDRSKEPSAAGRDRSHELGASRDRSKDRSKATSRERSRDRSRGVRAGGGGGREAAEPHPRRPSSSRDADLVLPPPPQERSSSRPRGDDGRRGPDDSRRGVDDSSRRHIDDSRRGLDDSRRGSRDSSRPGREQQPPQQQRRPPPMGFEDRQRLRERDRDRDGGERKRRSRSRSNSRGRHDWRQREEGRSYKRSRDEDRGRRHSTPELDIDPNALLETDALGLSKAQKEAEEEERRLEESRKRRQAILAKHQQATAVAAPTATAVAAAAAAAAGDGADGQQSQQQQQQQQQHEAPASPQQQQQSQLPTQPQEGDEGAGGDAAAAAVAEGTATPEGDRSSSEDSHNAPGTPVMDIWNTGLDEATSSRPAGPEEATSQLPVHMVLPGTEPNMQSERLRVGHPNPAAAAGADAAAAAAAAGGDAAAAAADGGDDMFADDDDMFGEGGAGGVKRGPLVAAGLMDNYDDPEGYYNFQVGELLDNRYEVFACKGKGVFSTVLRARDKLKLVPNPITGTEEFAEVAIKVIRSNETMAKAAALEQRILRLLSDKDPDNRKHVIRLLRTFEYRHHVCMVFEPLDMNLRELTLKYGRNVGLNIQAVGVYAAQLLVALRHLQQCGVLHADIKPDNILVNARRSKVKICDLGSAMLAGENERTPYLVSRFYRAPEVVLGLAYDFPMDMWSVGCVLYELFTGKILFPGRSNNEMLKLMMDVKGPFPKKMLKKGIFVEKHFEPDAQLSFSLVEDDPVTKQPVRRVITNPTVKHNVVQLLARSEGDKQQVAQLSDLLEKMLALDPEKRITADSALRHDFVKPYLPKKKGHGKH